MAKIIAVANQKGGVGKTTSCVNLCAALHAMGRRVLLVDCDPQGNSTSGMGVDKTVSQGVYDVLINGADVKSAAAATRSFSFWRRLAWFCACCSSSLIFCWYVPIDSSFAVTCPSSGVMSYS